jgi:hypothetical protein
MGCRHTVPQRRQAARTGAAVGWLHSRDHAVNRG